ncbi:MAG TPA: hypothetical protein PK073_02370 [Ignavibacteriaceae bacterium]|nr:MAG: hypothetical protein BWY38_00956 [Ignavibacteria bacterium ADurb.Bin266]HQF41730.1 hypothetical protein [Ignavibacteriaceae bacterium]HQI40965.1 hypothetical protein [Ignavibacteriaceae bacterium]HQJ45948.1 hypothetical protein [Ignavibacteriaceae bacterium]
MPHLNENRSEGNKPFIRKRRRCRSEECKEENRELMYEQRRCGRGRGERGREGNGFGKGQGRRRGFGRNQIFGN